MPDEIKGRGRAISDAIYGNPLTRSELNAQLSLVNRVLYFLSTRDEQYQSHVGVIEIKNKIEEERKNILMLLEIAL